MSGRWTKIVAAVSLAVVLGGCNPTAAPNKSGTAAEPLRRSASRVTRGTDRMVRGSTARGGNTTTTNRGGLFGMFSWNGARNGNRAGTGTGTATGNYTGRGATGAATTRNRNLWGALGGTTGAGRGRTGGSMSASKGNLARTGGGTGAFYFGRKGRMGSPATRMGSTAASRIRTAAGGTTQGPLHVIGFFTEDASASGLTALGRDPKALSYLSPWWYTLQSDGSVKDSSTAATRSWVKSHNVPVMPLVTNGGQSAVLTNNSAMKTAISNLVSLVDKNNYAGLNVDFQLLPSTARSGLNAFVDDLASQLHAKSKIVSVDIIPTAAQTGAGGAYDEVTLAHYADQLVLMTYDHHDDSSKAGPVSPHAWVVSSLQHALNSGVPAGKIFLGVNDYGYDWTTSGGKGVTIPQKVATVLQGTKTYDPTTTETKVTYTKNGQQHTVYYGGRQALADKVAIARKYKLYGIAIWKVGYENKAYWDELIKVNGDAASLHAGSASTSTAPSAAFKSKKHGKKPITHRPIGKKSGRRAGPKKTNTKGGVHSGTSRSKSGQKRGTK